MWWTSSTYNGQVSFRVEKSFIISASILDKLYKLLLPEPFFMYFIEKMLDNQSAAILTRDMRAQRKKV